MKKILLAITLAWSGAALAAVPMDTISKPQSGVFNQVKVGYTANLEHIPVRDDKAGTAADLVAFSYVASKAPITRPVVFIFNGGPIVPSYFLHILALGPKRLAIPDDLSTPPSSFKLVDNSYSLLDVADLVFFDPAGTGYSRVTDGTKPEAMFSTDADARQLTNLVQEWSRKHGRTASPKYLLGESYGTIRAAVAAQQIAELKEPQNLQGVILLGQALNIVETVYRPANIVSYTASLPTLAATGWYHGKVERRGRSFEQFMDEVRLFARTDYLVALYQGSALDAAEERRLAAKLADMTGLSAETFLASHLRISKPQYRNQLLKADGAVLGANDARYSGPAGKGDPADAVVPVVGTAFKQYISTTLGVPADGDYLTDSPVRGLDDWRWGATTPFSNWPYMDNIGKAMTLLPNLKLAIGVGYQDTLTTVGATEYAVSQSNWPAKRTHLYYYQGGHMFYTIEASLKRLSSDLHAMIGDAGDDH